MTNLIASVAITLVTNLHEMPHLSGITKTQTMIVMERHIVTYEWNKQKFALTNDYQIRTERKTLRRKDEWEEVPIGQQNHAPPPPSPL